MKATSILIAVTVAVLVALLLTTPADARPRRAEKRPTYTADDEQIDQLPDYMDQRPTR